MHNMDKQHTNITTFSIGEDQYPYDLAKDAKIVKQDLSGEFQSHAETFSFYATAYELALDHEARLKAQLDRIYAMEDYKCRTNASQANIKLTEKMVENTVLTQDAYVDATNQYLEAKKNVGLLRAAKDTLIQKRDMLMQLGALMRAEGASDISMKQEAVKNLLKGPKIA